VTGTDHPRLTVSDQGRVHGLGVFPRKSAADPVDGLMKSQGRSTLIAHLTPKSCLSSWKRGPRSMGSANRLTTSSRLRYVTNKRCQLSAVHRHQPVISCRSVPIQVHLKICNCSWATGSRLLNSVPRTDYVRVGPSGRGFEGRIDV